MEDSNFQPRSPTEAHPVPIPAEPVDELSGEVDIIVHCLSADGQARHALDITSKSQLRDFLRDCSPQNAAPNQYLLLIEDISPEVILELTNHLDVQTGTFEHHTRGRLNGGGTPQVGSVLHAQKLSSTLLGRAAAKKDNYSLTWWKLLTHSLVGYTYEREALTESDADATNIVVPHFNVHLSDTRRKVGSGKRQITQVKSGVKELLRQWKKTREEAEMARYSARKRQVEQTEETVYKLHCNTYRAHQVITEVKDDMWGSASEECLTYIKASKHGSTFYIFLFDKDRTLQECTQSFEIDYTGAKSFGVLDSLLQDETRKPTTRMTRERRGALVPTFLTSTEAKATSISAATGPGRGSRVYSTGIDINASDVSLKSTVDVSTRHRFLKYISQQGLLSPPSAQSRDDLPVRKVQLAFTRMIAEDWNLVLSQMGKTLDDIDSKMSDNNELRRNVLAWRRLLGSWRMTIIEYRAKLSETGQFLRSQMQQPVQGIASVLSTADSNLNQSAVDSIIQPIESQLEDILLSYQILTDGIKEIESRVERSFHALMSSMSIIESQKAIVQGSAVARLTELAFIFIPLNFACTFFSMQITNFQGDSQPSIGSFFALALPLMLFLYGLRAFIRSRFLYNITQKLETKIRETSKIPGTSGIPARVMVSFGWQQLGPFSRALLIVVPIAITVLVLITTLSQSTTFHTLGSIIIVLGTLTIISLLAIESYVPALQAVTVVAWLISMLGIGFGRIEPLNTAVMASLCTIVTTLFLIALAFIPQTISEKPKQRAAEILAPLWLIELPIAILCHYYNISNPRWEVWVFLIGLFSIFIVFGILVAPFGLEVYKSLAQIIALAAFSIGYPMAIVWSYAPLHGNHLPLYGAIIITFASVGLFFHLLMFFEVDDLGVSWAWCIFLAVLCCIVAIPITLVWDTLPSGGIPVPRYAQISVTCSSNILLATFITFVRPFSEQLMFLAWFLYWGATAAWLPALLWAGEIDAFKPLTNNRTNTIHVTWTSILFWTITWGIVACFCDSCTSRKVRKRSNKYRAG